MKDTIRELLKWLGEPPQLDTMEKWGADREKIKEYKSKILAQVADENRKRAPVELILKELVNLNMPQRLGDTHREDIGPNPKIDSVKLIVSTLKMLAADEYPFQPKIHLKYTGVPPNADNVKEWKDQWGYNVFETPRRKIADMALLMYESKYKKKLMRPEVKASDPVEFAPEPYDMPDRERRRSKKK